MYTNTCVNVAVLYFCCNHVTNYNYLNILPDGSASLVEESLVSDLDKARLDPPMFGPAQTDGVSLDGGSSSTSQPALFPPTSSEEHAGDGAGASGASEEEESACAAADGAVGANPGSAEDDAEPTELNESCLSDGVGHGERLLLLPLVKGRPRWRLSEAWNNQIIE